MNDAERAALVDSLHAELETAYGLRWGVDSMGVVMTIMPIIDRLLADRTPEPTMNDDALVEQVADALGIYFVPGDTPPGEAEIRRAIDLVRHHDEQAEPSLDALVRTLVDDCLPGRTVGICINEGQWYVQQMYTGLEEEYPTDVSGHGDTIPEAIRNAVASATEQEGASNELA